MSTANPPISAILAKLLGSRYHSRLKRRWWINMHSARWWEWAAIEPGGRVSIYDDSGHFVRGTDYGSRFKAIAALKRMGYRRINKRDLKDFVPPKLD